MPIRSACPGFRSLGSLFSSLRTVPAAFPFFLLLGGLWGCGCGSGSGSGFDISPAPPETSEIVCPCTADLAIDEWKPYENLSAETRILLATNKNVHHGISRGLYAFDIPETLAPSDVKKAAIYYSGCSHCQGGYSGRVGFYALNIGFDEATSTWYSLDGGDWDDAVHAEAVLPEGSTWNEAVNRQPPPDLQGFDVTPLLQNNLEKVRKYGLMMRFVDEHQEPYVHQNVASRESQDLRDFAPFIKISTVESPVQLSKEGEDFEPFQMPPHSIGYGPYSLKITTDAAIVAWEEQDEHGQLQHIEIPLANLEPETEYAYLVNGAAGAGRFVTPAVPGPGAVQPFSFFVVGDTQSDSQVSAELADAMVATHPDAAFSLHAGDLVSNGNDLLDWQEQWWSPFSEWLLRFPVYPAMGNHDLDSPYYFRYFSSLGGNGTNYSFDWGRVHCVVLDSNSAHCGSEEQMAWLAQDLAEHVGADFTVVTQHIPVFFSSTSGSNGMAYLQEKLLPVFEDNGVDVVFSGDVHGYQHHLHNGIHYVISAGGGGPLYDSGLPIPGMTLALAKAHHYLHCQVRDRSLEIAACDAEGNLFDRVSLVSGVAVEVATSVVVESDREVVHPGEQVEVGLYLEGVANLAEASFSMDYFRTEPQGRLEAVDADALSPGVQIRPGELGGTVVSNLAEADPGRLQYGEEAIGGLSVPRVKVASATFQVPTGAGATAFYLVPAFRLLDTTGNEIPHYMGGVTIAVQPPL
ncbi:MAG: metallophosphoesterase [bacterium]